jgi:cell division septation protein DedD
MKQEQGIPTGSLLGAFLAVVVLCAVFFSLGFFLGYRQGHPATTLATEQVPAPSDAPPDVNAPESSPPGASEEPRGTSASPSASPSQPAQSDSSPDQSSTAASARVPAAPIGQEARPDPAAGDEALGSTIASRVPSGLLVQVAAVTNRQDAANVVGVLKSKNYPALVLSPAQAKAKDSFYRVVAGPYKSRTQAERARKELTAEGFKPFIR